MSGDRDPGVRAEWLAWLIFWTIAGAGFAAGAAAASTIWATILWLG